MPQPPDDQATAAAFASSWNTVRAGSVYTREQFLDWIAPLGVRDLEGSRLVTPQTQYLSEEQVRTLLTDPQVDQASIYGIRRNGNSWKFGGRRAESVVS